MYLWFKNGCRAGLVNNRDELRNFKVYQPTDKIPMGVTILETNFIRIISKSCLKSQWI